MSPQFFLDALPDLVARVREAVVHVAARTDDGGVSGAGFAIPVAAADKAPGIVVTNAHVVTGDRPSVRVHTTGKPDQRVKIRLVDRSTDLALLELPEPAAAVLTPREDVRVGEPVIAIGSPLGYEASVTLGIISALGRLGWGTDYVPFDGAIQTDAAITHGNSGGTATPVVH
jgi:S1-C subfamily serine protease